MSGVATLSNEKNYTVFQFGNHVIGSLLRIRWNDIQQ